MSNGFNARIAVIGDNNVGKKTILHRSATGLFAKKLPKIEGIVINKYVVASLFYGIVQVEIGIVNSEKIPKRERNEFYETTTGAIFVADLSRRETVRRIPELIREYKSIVPDGAVVVMLNKLDLVNYQGPFLTVNDEKIEFPSSAKTGLNMELGSALLIKRRLFRENPKHNYPHAPVMNFDSSERFRSRCHPSYDDDDELDCQPCARVNKNRR